MAAPTITGKGINRSVEAATANFVFNATVAGDYDSTVTIPAGATILGSATKANVTMAGGTNLIIKMGPAASGDAKEIQGNGEENTNMMTMRIRKQRLGE